MGSTESDAGPVVTLRDVAAAAGVSLATASRSLSDSSHRVSEESRRRVLDAAARLDYVSHRPAQGVAQGRANRVALVVSDIADPYYSAVTAGVLAAAEPAGRLVTVLASERRHEIDPGVVAAVRGQRPRALVVAGSRVSDERATDTLVEELRTLQADGCRVVLVGEEGLPFDTVAVDNAHGTRALADALVELGYTSFAVLAGPRRLVTAQERLAGLRAGLSARGIELSRAAVIHSDLSRDGGYAAAGEMLTRYLGAQLVLTVDDALALGAMARLREAGLSVPRDLAISGYGGIAPLRDVTPSLTTLQLPLEELGARATELALTPSDEPRVVRVRGEVVLRASTPERSA